MTRGYFGIAAWCPKTTDNVGTLWRSAHVFGAAFLAIIEGRYHKQASDTTKALRHVPLYEYDTFTAFLEHRPHGCRLVAVEITDGAQLLPEYRHPEQAIYILGPEDGSLSPDILKQCNSRVVIPGSYCLNLAVAGSIVMYDRIAKAQLRSAPIP